MSTKNFTYEKKAGVKFPFVPNRNGYLVSLEDTYDAINQNLILFFKTERGSRVMRPTIGLRLRKRLGEPLSENILEDLSLRIKEQVQQFFPNITILDATLNQPSELYFDLIIKYKVKRQVNQLGENTIKIRIQ